MIGFRTGWVFSEPPAPQVQVPQLPSSEPATLGTLPPAVKSPALRLAAASSLTAPSVPTRPDELVIYDHGKVVFRTKPAAKESHAVPLVDASESSKITPAQGVWLAPDQADRRLRNRVEPQYPADASAAHRAGEVVLEVLVAEDGTVASIRTRSGDPLLAAAASEAVRQWRYEPYRVYERPSPFQTDVTLKFTLPN